MRNGPLYPHLKINLRKQGMDISPKHVDVNGFYFAS